jgi:hypothetical protein
LAGSGPAPRMLGDSTLMIAASRHLHADLTAWIGQLLRTTGSPTASGDSPYIVLTSFLLSH